MPRYKLSPEERAADKERKDCGHTLSKSAKKNIALKCRYSVMSTESECISEKILLTDIQNILGKILVKQFGVMQAAAKRYKESIKTSSSISVDAINGEITMLKKRRFASYEKFKDGDLSRTELDEIRNDISGRLEELEELLKAADKQEEFSEVKAHKADIVLNYGDENNFDENFINYFVKKVMVHKNKQLDITWNFGLGEFLDEAGGGNLYA